MPLYFLTGKPVRLLNMTFKIVEGGFMKKYGYAVPTRTLRKPAWNDIAARFSTDRDCLAAFVALQAA
jgi:hypothetical protein